MCNFCQLQMNDVKSHDDSSHMSAIFKIKMFSNTLFFVEKKMSREEVRFF